RAVHSLHASPEPARGVVGVVRARRELAVPAFRRQPRLDVELLRGGRAEVARGDVDDAVRQAETTDDLLFYRENALVLVERRLGLDEREHLDLVELVDAEDAARVLPVRSRLAPEARRIARVARGQVVG